MGDRDKEIARGPAGLVQKRAISRALEYVHDNLAGNLSLQGLAGAAGYSPHHFARLFKEATGLPPHRYVVSVMDNHSRCILASAVTRTQDLASYLSVLYAAVERYGSPEALVTDGGGVFRAKQARAVYEALGIAKHEIERGRPWQNYVESTFNVQRCMADWHFAKAEDWTELTLAHERFVEDYNGLRR